MRRAREMGCLRDKDSLARLAGLFSRSAKQAIVHGPLHVRGAKEKRRNVGPLCWWARKLLGLGLGLCSWALGNKYGPHF